MGFQGIKNLPICQTFLGVYARFDTYYQGTIETVEKLITRSQGNGWINTSYIED